MWKHEIPYMSDRSSRTWKRYSEVKVLKVSDDPSSVMKMMNEERRYEKFIG
jgi:hypothetical protein